MEKAGNRKRDIKFYSTTNQKVIFVHTNSAKQYADILENKKLTYQTNVALQNWTEKISLFGIRSSYRKKQWTSDFLITDEEGNVSVREIVDKELTSAVIEQLEISRRYWKLMNIADWKIIIRSARV